MNIALASQFMTDKQIGPVVFSKKEVWGLAGLLNAIKQGVKLTFLGENKHNRFVFRLADGKYTDIPPHKRGIWKPKELTVSFHQKEFASYLDSGAIKAA